MTKLLNGGPIAEHYLFKDGGVNLSTLDLGSMGIDCATWQPIYFGNDQKCPCVSLRMDWSGNRKLLTSYYVGTDWLEENKLAIYVEPKLDNEEHQTDIIGMLFTAMSHPDIVSHTDKLLHIKTDKPFIKLKSQLDILTPLLVLQFLQVLQRLVKQGLKRDYYPVSENLQNRVKGKVLVAQNIKQNIVKQQVTRVACSYSEYGLNSLENRVLKKALLYARNYLSHALPERYRRSYETSLNYVLPAFVSVSDEVSLSDLKATPVNPFFKHYRNGLKLAKLIIQRYGYNINRSSLSGEVEVPPFWIDMSKLFELYVLGKLQARHPVGITYQFNGGDSIPDYLYKSDEDKLIIDAKYKLRYKDGRVTDDVRQLAGYARHLEIRKHLEVDNREGNLPTVPCLIIYPDQHEGLTVLPPFSQMKGKPIKDYVAFFKLPIKLPKQEVQ